MVHGYFREAVILRSNPSRFILTTCDDVIMACRDLSQMMLLFRSLL